MSLRRRLAIGLAVLLSVPLVGIPLWIGLHRTDLPEPYDGDLALEIPLVAAEDNAWLYVVRASQLSVLVFEDDARLRAVLSGSERDAAWLRRTLRDNRPALDQLDKATAAREMVFVGGVEERFSPTIPVQSLARLANLDSRALPADARFERSRLGLRLGEAVFRARNPDLVDLMTAVTLQNISLREARLALEDWPLDAGASLRLSRELDHARSSHETWRRTWASIYAMERKAVRSMSEPTAGLDVGPLRFLPTDYIWQPNRTLTLFAEHGRAMARAFSEPCARGRDAFYPPYSEDKPKLLAAALHGNGVGVVLNSIATPNFEKFNLRRCHTEARLALLQIQMAVRASGSAPQSLEALVPRYLDRVPSDPFDGEPLRYDRARGLVYSVGLDFAPSDVYGPPSPEDELEPAIYVP